MSPALASGFLSLFSGSPPLFTSCVRLDKLLGWSEPLMSLCKMGELIVPSASGGYK